MRKQRLCGALAALVLAAALTAGSAAYAAPPAAEQTEARTETAAQSAAVRVAVIDSGISTEAVDAEHFSPDETCTRAQAAAFLHRALGLPEGQGDAAFSDVPEGAWYAGAVRWAVVADVTNGVGEGRFAPDEHCARAQIVTFLWRSYNG